MKHVDDLRASMILAEIERAVFRYHYALDTHSSNGAIAAGNLADDVETILRRQRSPGAAQKLAERHPHDLPLLLKRPEPTDF